jgi:hypothetical protein
MLCFLCSVLTTTVCPFVPFLLVIVLSVFWPLYCLSFGHCIVFFFGLGFVFFLAFVSKDRQYNDQKTDNTMAKRQTKQWPKDRQYNDQKTDNTMAKRQTIQ